MPEFREASGYSIVSAILPRHTSAEVMERALLSKGFNAISTNARGTLLKDRWYQSFLPVLSPEQTVAEVVVPNEAVDGIMEKIVSAGKLSLSGAGAIYSVRCTDVMVSDQYPLMESESIDTETSNSGLNVKEDLVGIFCIAQPEDSDAICRAAVQAGAPGPTVYYCEGRGLRDRLLLLRITKTAEKELIQVIVDPVDADPVFSAIAEAGRLSEPGRGIVYRVPIAKGLINVASVYGRTKHSASIQQIVAALDDLSGSSEWRAQAVTKKERKPGSRTAFPFLGLGMNEKYLEGLVMLTCITNRKYSAMLTNRALAAGAPAASVAVGKFYEADAETTTTGARLNRERGLIKMMLSPARCAEIRGTLLEAANENSINEIGFFTYSVPRALTYLG
jgi:nitrogen regulatory protein PII